MTDPNEPIRMELRSERPAGAVPSSPGDPPDEAALARWVVAAALVAVSVLGLGVWIGRATAPSDRAADVEVTTPERIEPSPPVVRVLATVPPADTVPPAASSVAAATPPGEEDDGAEPDEPAPSSQAVAVEIDERLAGSDLRVVGLGNGELFELDFATGTLTITEAEPLVVRSDIPQSVRQIVAGPDWTLVGDPWGGATTMIRPGEPPTEIGFHDIVSYRAGADTFWALGRTGDEILEHDLDGEPTGNAVAVSEFELVRDDPAGGVVIERGGRLYSMAGSDPEPLPVGDLMALSETTAVVYGCDDELACTVRIVDRATGDSREVAPAGTFEPLNRVLFGGRPPSASLVMSPTGRHTVVTVRDDFGFDVVLLDLETGEVTDLPASSEPWTVSTAWAPDGDVLIVCTGTRLRGLDVETGESFNVVSGTGGTIWYRIAVRPDAPPAQPSS